MFKPVCVLVILLCGGIAAVDMARMVDQSRAAAIGVPAVKGQLESPDDALPPPPDSKKAEQLKALVEMGDYIAAEDVDTPNHTAEEMGAKAPKITMSGHKLQYDPEQKGYCYAEVATKGPFAGKKQRAMWMMFVDNKTKKPVFQLSGQPDQIDEATGLQYKRQQDGEWAPNGCYFHKDDEGWTPNVLCLEQVAMYWDKAQKTFIEYETKEPVKVVWVKEGGETGWRTQKMIRTDKAHQLNPRADDGPEPQK